MLPPEIELERPRMTVDSSNVPRKPNTVISHEDFHGGKIPEPIIGFLKSQTDCQGQSGFYTINAKLLRREPVSCTTTGVCLLATYWSLCIKDCCYYSTRSSSLCKPVCLYSVYYLHSIPPTPRLFLSAICRLLHLLSAARYLRLPLSAVAGSIWAPKDRTMQRPTVRELAMIGILPNSAGGGAMMCPMMDAATDAMAGAAPGDTVNSSCW